MPDYILDQVDHIEDNTQKLLKLVNTLVERQNDTSEQLQKLMAQNKDLHINLKSYQSVTGTVEDYPDSTIMFFEKKKKKKEKINYFIKRVNTDFLFLLVYYHYAVCVHMYCIVCYIIK